jgi:hypothetical protein
MKFWALMDARERTALVISAAIVLTVIGYWAVQVEGVRAMLKLAYPG